MGTYRSKVLLQVLVPHVLQVELLLAAGPRLLEAERRLVVVLRQRRLLRGGLVLVGLAERVRRQPLVQRKPAGVQRDALQREAGR